MFEGYSGKKCNCPHCRGGHPLGEDFKPIEYQDGSNYEIENEITEVNVTREDPDELISQYIEAVLECESPEEIEEVMIDFFNDVFLHALQETYITEIEGKIEQLNLIKNGLEDED